MDSWCPQGMVEFLGHNFPLAMNSAMLFKAFHNLTWVASSFTISLYTLQTGNTGRFRSMVPLPLLQTLGLCTCCSHSPGSLFFLITTPLPHPLHYTWLSACHPLGLRFSVTSLRKNCLVPQVWVRCPCNLFPQYLITSFWQTALCVSI